MEGNEPGRRKFIKGTVATAAGLTLTAGLRQRVLGANDRLRIGLIGCGSRGNYLLGEALRLASTMNLEVTALCDVWRVNRERTAARLETAQKTRPQTFSRYTDLLAVKDLDGVIIATPDFAHTPILIEATRQKKDAFVEKPMATVLDHANLALKLVNENKTIVQVGTQRRSDRRHQKGARFIQSGIIGKISEVESAWHDAAPRWARDFSDVRQEDVDWEQYLMFLPKEPFNAARFRRWHLYKDFTVGTPGLLGSHLIDVAIWFMDDPLPSSAVAHGGVYVWKDGREHADTLDCILEYPKGFILNYSTRLGNRHTTPEIVFYGTKGTFDTLSWTARGEGGGADALTSPVTVQKPVAETATAVPVSTQNNPAMAQNDPRVEGEGHVRNWVECMRSRSRPNAPIEAGHAHSVASIMCFKAWESGRRQIFDTHKMEIKAG